MEKKVLNIYQFKFDKSCFEHNEGVSQTVPHEATSLKDLVRRAAINATLPDIAKTLEFGDDEDFEDAFEPGQDLSDYYDNLSYIEKVSLKLKQEKDKAKAEKAKNSKNDGTSPVFPTDGTPKIDNATGEA